MVDRALKTNDLYLRVPGLIVASSGRLPVRQRGPQETPGGQDPVHERRAGRAGGVQTLRRPQPVRLESVTRHAGVSSILTLHYIQIVNFDLTTCPQP